MCNSGELTFVMRVDLNRPYLECDECLSGFEDISIEGVGGHFWTDLTEWEDRPASHSDVVGAGLGWSIRSENQRIPDDA
ncbi:hypothetical protein ACWGE1_07400 [Streptomyces sp. NPDC054932]